MPTWRSSSSVLGLEVVGVDGLDDDLSAERLGRLAGLTLELDVARRDEVHPAQDVEARALRMGGGAPGGQDPLEPSGGGEAHGGALDERAACHDPAPTAAILLLASLHRPSFSQPLVDQAS